MANNSKNILVVSISVAAIVISLVAIAMPLQTASQPNTSHYTGKKREFWLFDTDIPALNETKMGMSHDIFSISSIAAYKGDTIVIHFFNIEAPSGDSHSFTIFEKPYDVNAVLNPGENKTITLDANTTGTFTYLCTFHQPTMRGQLIVQPPPF